MRFAIILFVTFLIAVPVFAGPPLNGTYKSTDLGGSMLTGRFSESWTTPAGHLTVANTTNAMSWDGGTLATQWVINCAQIAFAPVLLTDTVDLNGNGTKQWLVTYPGGIAVLDGTGPWGNAEPSYTALLDSYQETQAFLFTSFALVGVNSTISLDAQVIGFNQSCVSLVLANSAQISTTDAGPLAPGFPGFLDPATCAATRTLGNWGEVDQLTLVITGCQTPVEESTWGMIKTLYGN